ncbi:MULTISPECIES: nucleoside triphosphate hydrolase [Halocynthiibacter]|uniref:Nucleoside triphosphate hydrolase n=1 Tax=Halocynthiibacter halioticoli TaxID=2986804 RepID=A0AAE3IYS6_9RHOB|nr:MULTISPECIES: nucleoside triphosphate hydrolase [Halocynthiibacter]MCV6822961.1 nucleoside triphosphate hydrolase [Halocynthiibacter halioticoli]MCW4055962.1 nucleoside triphosphate hydrolase [Halocynthiibacter sp. SDUM655004]
MIERDVQRVCELISSLKQDGARTIVAIAGPPASGKSTLAEAVVRSLNAQAASEIPAAELVPMDGYHLDNRILKARGLLARKGAPETFDAAGFCDAIKRLQSTEKELFFPIFDRQLDLSIANAIAIHQETPIIVVEGNYLLLKSDPWKSLANVYSATVFVSPTLEVLENRLIQRWIEHGFDSPTALKRAKMNDLPNAALVVNNSVAADLTLGQNDH